jgi:ATP-dependent NAD(P)H-hydrate dehydratase
MSDYGEIIQQIDTKADPDTLCPQLARALQNTTILQKGASDIVSNGLELPSALLPENQRSSKKGKREILKNEVKGGLKRCGGQGDILSGSVGVLLAWGTEWVNGTYA